MIRLDDDGHWYDTPSPGVVGSGHAISDCVDDDDIVTKLRAVCSEVTGRDFSLLGFSFGFIPR